MSEQHTPPLAALRSSTRLFALFVAFCLGLVLAIFGRDILSDKYYRDESEMLRLVEFIPPNFTDTPFGQTAEFYRLLGLTTPAVAGALSVTLCAVLVWIARPAPDDPWWTTVVLAAFFVLSGVYLAGLNKELLVLPVIIGAALIRDSATEAAWLLLALAYAYEFRANWLGVVVLYLVIRFALPYVRTLPRLALAVTALIGVLAVGFDLVLGEDLHYHRSAVTDALSADINTRIVDPLPADGILYSFANGVYSLVCFLFPVPLAQFGEPMYLAAAAFIGATWLVTFARLHQLMRNPAHPDFTWYSRLFAFVLAFTLIQSFYAPDWGAYVRHISPTLPLFALFLRRHPLAWGRPAGKQAEPDDRSALGAPGRAT